VLVQPLLEQRVHFPGQADDDAEGRTGAGIGRCGQDALAAPGARRAAEGSGRRSGGER
jgi:hypothetical protein